METAAGKRLGKLLMAILSDSVTWQYSRNIFFYTEPRTLLEVGYHILPKTSFFVSAFPDPLLPGFFSRFKETMHISPDTYQTRIDHKMEGVEVISSQLLGQ